MSSEKPLLVLQPSKKWVYSILLSSLLGLVVIIVASGAGMKYLEAWFFQVNWFRLLDSLSGDPQKPPVLSANLWIWAVAFLFILLVMCLIFLWILLLILLVPILVIVPIYTVIARKYIVYEFFPKMLVIHRGIFVKTRKVYPYRSITKTDHVQVFTGRIFSISNLILYEPSLGPAGIEGIDNSTLTELFLEFQHLLLKTANREMVYTTTNGINLRAAGNNEQLGENTVVTDLARALSDLRLTMRHLGENLENKKNLA
ncbi:MAG: PH domain-containing protein [Candidatus Odinarchaeota archaeon]